MGNSVLKLSHDQLFALDDWLRANCANLAGVDWEGMAARAAKELEFPVSWRNVHSLAGRHGLKSTTKRGGDPETRAEVLRLSARVTALETAVQKLLVAAARPAPTTPATVDGNGVLDEGTIEVVRFQLELSSDATVQQISLGLCDRRREGYNVPRLQDDVISRALGLLVERGLADQRAEKGLLRYRLKDV